MWVLPICYSGPVPMRKDPAMLRPIAVLALTAMLMLVGCESKITEENLTKIQVGMTVVEVEAILGKGRDDSITGVDIGGAGISSAGSSGTMTLTYEGDKFDIIVNYDEGLVRSVRKF